MEREEENAVDGDEHGKESEGETTKATLEKKSGSVIKGQDGAVQGIIDAMS